MGQCLCTPKLRLKKPAVAAHKRRNSHKEASYYLRSGRVTSSCHSVTSSAQSYQLAPPVHELLRHARRALEVEAFYDVEAETLCCLALALSGGQDKLETWSEDINESRVGLCQMTVSTAASVAQSQKRRAFGDPSKEKLCDPVAAFYYAAACLQELAAFGDEARSLDFVVKAYVAGPKAVCQHQADALPAEASDSRPTAPGPPPTNVWDRPWANFVKAQRHLLNLATLESQAEAELSPMHVMQRDETIASIARACHETVPELYKINPDLPANVQCGDCIVLPHPCAPRIYWTQRGDTWAGIASWLHIPPSRLRAKNREAQVLRQSNSILMSLTNACVLREGQLLEVPGLGNGTSVCSDDSRIEDPPTTELLVLSPRHAGQVTMRSPPPGVIEDALGVLPTSEIVHVDSIGRTLR